MSYVVESSKYGGTKNTRMKTFNTRKAAERYAYHTHYNKGYAVSVDELNKTGQHTLIQRGFKPEGKSKLAHKFAENHGNFKYKHSHQKLKKLYNKKHVRKEVGFGLGLFR